MARPTASRLVEARAECSRCAWNLSAKNAQALAAQHYDQKGHRVTVTTTTEIIYGQASGAKRDGGGQKVLL